MTFKRAGHGQSRLDERGRIVIKIMLQDTSKKGLHLVKGNMMKSISIDKAKVSEIFRAIEKALF